ncbi:YpmS family protein [Latilactobacillus sp. 5-91]|uniref:YpmS family protein n=1 Tax=Latilactobacillus sp. 5-91 TaxID=3410924 RepID=UPI003C70CF0B
MQSRQDLKKEQVSPKRTINYWKYSFIVLLALVIGTLGFIAYNVSAPQTKQVQTEKIIKADSTFDIQMHKKQINSVVAYYLENYLENSKVKYNFTLDQQAILSGQFKFLGFPVEFNLFFKPYVLENGDIQLRAKQLAVGQLKVPMSFVFNYIQRQYKFPKWVVLNAHKSRITLRLNEFKLANGMQVKARHIDLKNDKIDLSVYVPLKNKK